jgi:hypothetical protein
LDKIELTLEFRNCRDRTLSLSLEINPDIYDVLPGQQFVIHAVCAPEIEQRSMCVEWYSDSVNVYPPGLGSECEDFFVTHEGMRLTPKNR